MKSPVIPTILAAGILAFVAQQATVVAGPAIDPTKLVSITPHATPGTNPLDLGGVEVMKIVRTNTFSIGAGFTLDITNNSAIINNVGNLSSIGVPSLGVYNPGVDGGGGTGKYTVGSIQGLIQTSAYDGPGTSVSGMWDGIGITSSRAATDVNAFFQVGAASNLDLGLTNWVSAPTAVHPAGYIWATSLAANSILIKMTYFGDANLDGVANNDDYALIDLGAGSAGALSGWGYGDFNYDGVIDGNDYALMDIVVGVQGTPGFPATLTGGMTGAGAVPEPASIGLLMLGAVSLLGRRRRA